MANSAAVTYQVTAVAPETQYNQLGTAIPGKRLTITTSAGYEGTVFVPDSVFGDLAAVQEAVEGEVRRVAAARAITGSVAGA